MAKQSDKLKRAAELIDKYGHCKGAFFGDNGEFCILGAIKRANKELDGIEAFGDEILHLVRGYPFRVGPYQGSYLISEWNDNPKTTKDDVLVALKAAYLSALEAEGGRVE